MKKDNSFLFSVDLEDVSAELEGTNQYTDRVRPMTEKYLELLDQFKAKATFFTTGDAARKFPDLIQLLVKEGHEVACHTDQHTPLNRQTAATFMEDLNANIDALKSAGAENIVGFRAPIFSLTPGTRWAYEVLNDLGFVYSSSVLPAANPLYGWSDFGVEPRVIDGLFEIPLSLIPFNIVKAPMSGGAYFRLLPLQLINFFFRLTGARGLPVVGYFHPQDCDAASGSLRYKEYNHIYNFLLNFNKSSVFKKLEYLLNHGFRVEPCIEYVHREIGEQK